MTGVDLLAFGAHPDDVEMIAGGTLAKMIARGRRVVIADLTRGEMGTRGEASKRALEAKRAAGILGVEERVNLDMGDGVLEDTMENRARLIETVRRYRPALVLCHWREDLHPDHAAAGRMAEAVIYSVGFEKFPAGGEPYRPKAFLFYMGHIPFTPSFVVDTSGFFAKKMEAVKAYTSQLHDPASTERPTGISRPDFLLRIEARDRHFGGLIEGVYGEPFKMKRALPVDDPVALFAPLERIY